MVSDLALKFKETGGLLRREILESDTIFRNLVLIRIEILQLIREVHGKVNRNHPFERIIKADLTVRTLVVK